MKLERCRACLGMGYKGRDRRGKWKIETCRSCMGRGERSYQRAEAQYNDRLRHGVK